MNAVVRFAPSPTGYLHPGNARTALLNWEEARVSGGKFILRIDDTDTVRSEQKFTDAIIEDLAWLGITPDLIVAQSERFERYEEVFEQLRAARRVYPCYETQEELDFQRAVKRRAGAPPIYDRRALELTESDVLSLESQGRKPYWRYLLDHQTEEWEDICRGDQKINLSHISDPVIRRADGAWLYTLPSVVDDIDLEINLVVRGEDHVTNTAVQVNIFAALGHKVPNFAHHPLLTASDGSRLSKRDSSLSLRNLKQQGFEASAVSSLLLGIGGSSIENSAEGGSILRAAGSSSACFDMEMLLRNNAKTLQSLDFSQVVARLNKMEVTGNDAWWQAVKTNISNLNEAKYWWDIVNSPPSINDDQMSLLTSIPNWRSVLTAALSTLPLRPWNNETWKKWTAEVANECGSKGKNLYLPLRIALTGRSKGPDMSALLPELSNKVVKAALENVIATTV